MLGAPCPLWRVVADPAALIAFGDETGWPVIAKSSPGGDHGKGVWEAQLGRRTPTSRSRTWPTVSPVIAEELIAFRRELSALVVRSPSGQAVAYPVSESVQRNGVCVETTTPAPGLDDDRTVRIPAAGSRTLAPRARSRRPCSPSS